MRRTNIRQVRLRVTDTHTHRHDYCNLRCACAPRVNGELFEESWTSLARPYLVSIYYIRWWVGLMQIRMRARNNGRRWFTTNGRCGFSVRSERTKCMHVSPAWDAVSVRCPDLGGVRFSEVYISSTVVSIRSLVFVRFSEVVRFSARFRV